MLGAFQPHAPGLFAQLGFDSMHSKLDVGHAKVMRQRAMDAGGELANHFVTFGDLAKCYRIAAVLRRLSIFDDSKRNDVGGVSGIPYLPKGLDNRVIWYLSCH